MWYRSATFQLTLIAVLVMAVALMSLTWLSLRWQRAWLLEEVERGLLLTSDALQSSLRQGMMQNQRGDIRRSIERVTEQTRIDRIRLIEHRGRITMSTRPEDSGGRLDRNAADCTICHKGLYGNVTVIPASRQARATLEGNRMRAFTPVVAEARCFNETCHQQEKSSQVLGVIEVSLSLEDAEKDFARRQATLAGIAVGAILLGAGLLSFALMRRFRRPMRDLLRGIRRVAAGDLDHRIPERARDEFGELARSFNAMSQKLSNIQQSLVRSERLISMGKLAAGVAHEINNPLTGILSYAEGLLSEAEEDDSRREDYAVIVHEALRCRQIVRSLLDFARQAAPSFSRVSPQDIIGKAVNMVVRLPAFRAITFERQIEPGLPTILADPVQIEQVLINLIVNAQEAMPNGGTIELGARRSSGGNQMKFSVRDEGSGIPQEIHSRIFDPFFSTKGGKTDGLGLAVCLGIVQQHGGTIDFRSERGQGTVFDVTLPFSDVSGQDKEGGETDG
jgi:two-component system NtrC family sensor kinase